MLTKLNSNLENKATCCSKQHGSKLLHFRYHFQRKKKIYFKPKPWRRLDPISCLFLHSGLRNRVCLLSLINTDHIKQSFCGICSTTSLSCYFLSIFNILPGCTHLHYNKEKRQKPFKIPLHHLENENSSDTPCLKVSKLAP